MKKKCYVWYALILLLLSKSILCILGNLCRPRLIKDHFFLSFQSQWMCFTRWGLQTFYNKSFGLSGPKLYLRPTESESILASWFFFSIHSESKGSYLWILPSFCWTKRIISWFRRYQKHWTSNNSNKEGYILSTLYELNLTAMSCVLYLSPRFLGCTNNLQYAAGRYVRGNLIPALLSNNPWLWWLDNYASSICPSALRRRNGSSFLLLLSLTLIHCLLWGYHHLFHLSYQFNPYFSNLHFQKNIIQIL